MHVPDGFMDTPTCAVAGVLAVMGVTHAVRSARAERPDDDRVPMAALVATFVFAAQLINVPIAGGTSGHLIGATLAAVLVGPATAVVCLTAVLAVQAVFFADGGVAALGVNVTLMALVGTLVGWAVFHRVSAVLPRSRVATPLAAAVGALVSVPVAAGAFAVIIAVGGRAEVGLADVLAPMVGWHALIGVGEALVTAAVVAAVTTVRPDLVHGARSPRPTAAGHAA